MPPRSMYPMADQILDGRLSVLLIEWRADGLSFDAIARRLAEHGIEVTGETVRLWVRQEAAS